MGSEMCIRDRGESKVADYLPKPEMAALTTVANVILNLDEVINR